MSDPGHRDELAHILTGSYTKEGVEAWFHRPRTWLDGKTPQQIIDSGNEELIQTIKERVNYYLK